jgi:hypothetical protein
MPAGLQPPEFRKLTLAHVGRVLEGGGEVFTFIGKTVKGEIPIGMVVANMNGKCCEPHVFWFAEATPRNKLECSLKWIVDMKEKVALFLWVREPDAHFFEHLGKYGCVRCVGKYRNFPLWSGDAYLFQGVT